MVGVDKCLHFFFVKTATDCAIFSTSFGVLMKGTGYWESIETISAVLMRAFYWEPVDFYLLLFTGV